MGCNNSHLRPFFRRCRRRRSKKDDPSVTPKGDYIEIERNGSGDLTHGIQFLGASLRNPNNKASEPNNTPGDSTFCVPLLAQAEASSSQIDFFKMLDEKIEQGPDYDSSEDGDPRSNYIKYSWRKASDGDPPPRPQPLNRASKLNNYSWDEDGD